jgi:hypothetical protein
LVRTDDGKLLVTRIDDVDESESYNISGGGTYKTIARMEDGGIDEDVFLGLTVSQHETRYWPSVLDAEFFAEREVVATNPDVVGMYRDLSAGATTVYLELLKQEPFVPAGSATAKIAIDGDEVLSHALELLPQFRQGRYMGTPERVLPGPLSIETQYADFSPISFNDKTPVAMTDIAGNHGFMRVAKRIGYESIDRDGQRNNLKAGHAIYNGGVLVSLMYDEDDIFDEIGNTETPDVQVAAKVSSHGSAAPFFEVPEGAYFDDISVI